jgi:hypothetical protein
MSDAPWFRCRPPPRQSTIVSVSWQGYALLIGCIAAAVLPLLLMGRLGGALIAVWPVWLIACLAMLFAIAARHTEKN